MKIPLLFDKDVPEDIRELARVIGHFEQETYGNRLKDMVDYEIIKSRQEMRNIIMAHFGYKYSYVETNTVVLKKE